MYMYVINESDETTVANKNKKTANNDDIGQIQ